MNAVSTTHSSDKLEAEEKKKELAQRPPLVGGGYQKMPR